MSIPEGLIRRLRQVTRVAVLTGAGVSAESGVPTFRDAQTGLWSKYTPEELATPGAFLRNPKLVWEWYAWRRQLVASALPNAAHQALAELQHRFPEFQLITQNVDGLHQRAGSDPVIELHGNIHRTKCFREGTLIESWPATDDVPPKCPQCGGPLRPDVVWFEEPLPEPAIEQAATASRACEAFLCIGTSAVVYPAAALPKQALRANATLIEINPEPTPLTEHAHFALSGKAGDILPALVAALG